MGDWNYRVVQSLDGTEYYIAEVYYDGDKLAWVDDLSGCLRWERFDDLKSTVDFIRAAFTKPVLRVTEEGHLVELMP